MDNRPQQLMHTQWWNKMKKPAPIRSTAPMCVLFAGSIVCGQSVSAGGFALIEQGASGMGNAYAGASAVSHDASTVWFNPAGMLELDRPQLAVAGHIVDVNSDFSDRGTTLNPVFGLSPVSGASEVDAGGVSFLPNLYYVRAINEDLAFGLGVSVPFGNSTEYGRDWVGRYQAVESSVSVVDINPSIAYRVNPKLNVGGGISVQVFNATLGSSVDSEATCLGLATNPNVPVELADCANAGLTEPGTLETDGYADITGDSVAATFNLGVLFKPRFGTKIGLAYRHSIDHELDGDAEFTTDENLAALLANRQVPLFANVDASAEAELPPSVMLSIAHQANDKIELLADATFTGWSSLPELRIEFDNPVQPDTFNTLGYEDVWRLSAGLNYKYSDQMTLRAGVAYDEDPVPSAVLRTPRIPGEDRAWLAFGLGYQINDSMGFDLGFAHLFIDDTPIANVGESAGGTTIRGVFDTNANLLSAQFNYKFQ